MRSRPRRLSRTSPARESTVRCFVIACRDTEDFALRRAIESGPFADRRTSSRSRVSSPSAANSGAASRTCAATIGLACDMALNVLHLRGPPLAVHAERLVATVRRQAIEARLDDRELRSVRRLLEPELDQRRG